MLRATTLCLAILPGLAGAETPVSAPITAAAFEAHVTGHTVTYQKFGQPFGIEEYLDDRRVRWSVSPDHCQYGTWYPEGDNICFVYEYDPNPACWTFWLQGGALVARSVNDLPGNELYETAKDNQSLPCPGPDVGV